jgi:hypothetical protein
MLNLFLNSSRSPSHFFRLIKATWSSGGLAEELPSAKLQLPNTAGNRLFKSTKNDYENELNMFTCFGPLFEILNLLKIIYFNSDKM